MESKPFWRTIKWVAGFAVGLVLTVAGVITVAQDYKLIGIPIAGLGALIVLIFAGTAVRVAERKWKRAEHAIETEKHEPKQPIAAEAKVPLGTLASLRKLRNHTVMLRDNCPELDPELAIPTPTVERWHKCHTEATRIMYCVEEVLADYPKIYEAFGETLDSLRNVEARLTKENSFRLLTSVEDMVECFDTVLDRLSRD